MTKRNALVGFITLTLLGGVVFGVTHWNSKGSSTDSPVSSKDAAAYRIAPDFALQDAEGKAHKLSDFRGKIVLLHFWASWCPPCLGEIPNWLEMAEAFKGKPVQLFAVSLDESWQAAHKVLPTDHLPPGVVSVIDPKTQVSEQYGSYAFPETYLISPKGEIITKWVGPQDWKNPNFVRMMDELSQKVDGK
ncbi:MAG: peroxiredoxin family protein [Bdellovibrionia bacterium]